MSANNSTADAQVSVGYSGPLASMVACQGVPGARYWATDTGQYFRHNGAAWLPLISRVDTECLSTALPSPSKDGLYYHTTDTNQVYRDNGTALVQVMTQLPATFPAGTVAFLPVAGSFTANKFFVDIADSPPTLPTGWAYCAGQAVSTTTYPLLFALFGYNFTFSGWTLTCGSQTYPFASLPTLSQVQSALAYLGISTVVDTFNPNLVISPAWSLAPSGISSGGLTFNLPYGVARPEYSYVQSSYATAEAAGVGLASPLGWTAISGEPSPANPYLVDGNPAGCYAVVIKLG
jgi:hypothetical protein